MSGARVQLRHAVTSDLDSIVTLERATENAPHWPSTAYAAILNAPGAGVTDATAPRRCPVVALADKLLVGFAVGLMHPSPTGAATSGEIRIAELESVVVAANIRRSGVGRALCVAVFDWCRSQGATEVVLEVRAASTAAIALYSGLGFKQIGQRLRYYHDPEDDALLMRLRLG